MQRSAPERRKKARARDQFYAFNVLAFARVCAFVVGFELRFKWPTLASPCTYAVFTFNLRIPGAHQAYWREFMLSTQSKETTSAASATTI